MEVSNINTAKETTNDKDEDVMENIVQLPISDDMLSNLQLQDTFCSHIKTQIEKANIKEGQTYKVQNNLLKRYVTDGDNTYETVVLPRALIAQVLKMAHNDLGHNGTHRTYMFIQKVILLERVKTKHSKTYTKMLPMSMKE